MTGTLVTAPPRQIDWRQLREMLNRLNRIAMQDLVAVYDRAREMDPVRARLYLEQAMMDMAETYGAAAGDLTVDWWNDIAMDDMYRWPRAADLNYEILTKSVRWGVAPVLKGAPLGRLAGVLQRTIFGAQRDTVLENSPGAWQRLAHRDACPFCRVLASRGAVYTTRMSGAYVGGARWDYNRPTTGKYRVMRAGRRRNPNGRPPGAAFHDHCRCIIAPVGVPNTHLEVPDYYDQFLEEYTAATRQIPAGETLTMKNVTAVMRQQLKDRGIHHH